MTQKRRKRRRMLRERSPSPPTVQNKRQTPSPRLALSTRYSPDDMNNSPNFEEKKKFLTIFNLTHVSAEKRKGRTGRGARGRPRDCGEAGAVGPRGMSRTSLLVESENTGARGSLGSLRRQGGSRSALTRLPRGLSRI